MKHSLKLRSETNATPAFEPVERLSFCTSNVKEAIGDNMDAIAQLSVSGAFRVIPKNATKTQVDEAVGFAYDWDATDADRAAQLLEMDKITSKGGLAYHYELVVHRYFEETDGQKREGAVTSRRSQAAGAGRQGIV